MVRNDSDPPAGPKTTGEDNEEQQYDFDPTRDLGAEIMGYNKLDNPFKNNTDPELDARAERRMERAELNPKYDRRPGIWRRENRLSISGSNNTRRRSSTTSGVAVVAASSSQNNKGPSPADDMTAIVAEIEVDDDSKSNESYSQLPKYKHGSFVKVTIGGKHQVAVFNGVDKSVKRSYNNTDKTYAWVIFDPMFKSERVPLAAISELPNDIENNNEEEEEEEDDGPVVIPEARFDHMPPGSPDVARTLSSPEQRRTYRKATKEKYNLEQLREVGEKHGGTIFENEKELFTFHRDEPSTSAKKKSARKQRDRDYSDEEQWEGMEWAMKASLGIEGRNKRAANRRNRRNSLP